MSDGPILRVSGVPYQGWELLRVNKSLDQICGTFQAQISDRLTEGGEEAVERWPIKRNAPCTIETSSGEVLLTAYAETITPAYNGRQHTIMISGRGITCDLVDCSYIDEKREWIDETVESIVKKICEPFEILVVVEANAAFQATDASKKLDRFEYNEGETAGATIQRACGLRALRAIDLGDGRITLLHSGDEQADDVLRSGINIKSARGTGSDRDRFGLYIVKASSLDTDLTDEDDEEDFIEPEGREEDPAIFSATPHDEDKRFRPFVIQSNGVSTNAECKQQAEWIARQRAGDSREWQILTGGWEQSNGKLWPLNRKTLVVDPFMGLDGLMLISALGFEFGRQGSQTKIGVSFPEKYELLDTGDNLVNVTDQFDGGE